jgi:hypothetical protein
MTRVTASIAARMGAALRRYVDRTFERLERAHLKDLERSAGLASNSRELSQRLHRLEVGEMPLP